MTRILTIRLVTFGTSIVCPGFRRISSAVKQQFSDVVTYIYDVSGDKALIINDSLLDELADADVVGFSCATQSAAYVQSAINSLKACTIRPLIVWGGAHASVFPEDAIKYADVVCIGEGEHSLACLLDRLSEEQPINDVKGFWVNIPNGIVKNASIPLMTGDELSKMPFQDFGFDIFYVTSMDMTRLDESQYNIHQGSVHTVLWSLGCPYHCTFCSNDKFIANNAGNAIVRYPSPEYMIEELRLVLKEHRYFSHISFTDDNFMLIKYEDIKLFCELYDRYIKLPFVVLGIHPLTIDTRKIDALLKVGLRKVRMGIQSGSERTLSFYNRKTPRQSILRANNYLASLYPQIIPPFYDIIIDNPIETDEDKMSTVALLYEMKRPFILSVHSLRAIPGTQLYEFAQKNPQRNFLPIEYSSEYIQDKGYAFLLYLLALWHSPAPLLNMFLYLSRSRYFSQPAFFIVQSLHAARVIYWENKLYGYPKSQVISRVFNRLIYKLLRIRYKGTSGAAPEWTVKRL